MMKKLVLILLPVLVISLIVGCGGKPDIEPDIPPPGGEVIPPVTPPDTGTAGVDEIVERVETPEFEKVYFDFDKYNLRDDAKRSLRHNADELKSFSDVTITIEGHCDERGTVEYNLALGERRARSVRDYLISLGVEPGRVSVISYGKERPVALGHDEISWAKNRRAEFLTN